MDLFELAARLSLDSTDYLKGLAEAEGKAKGFGGVLKTGLSSLGKLGAAAVAASGAALTAVGGGIVKLTKDAVDAFSDYQQLIGGTELLFGEAYDTVMQYSTNAYKTVQMSQREYLQQVNGFAVGLKTSLGGNEQAAAELANKIITAQADVVAATGNTQEAVQNAFNGIMKGNFTMLDNLQLGIAPTKEGFQEVIDKVNEWNKANGEATKYQMGNLADMEAALVDYIEMQGLAGYASNEAMSTISGAASAAKAAWQNVVSAIGGGGDLKEAFDGLKIAIFGEKEGEGLFAQLVPVVETAIGNAAKVISESAVTFGPAIAQAAGDLAPQLLEAAASVISNLILGLLNAAPNMTPTLIEVVMQIATTIIENAPRMLSVGFWILQELLRGLVSNMPALVKTINDAVMTMISTITLYMPEIIALGAQIISELITGIAELLPELIPAMVDLVNTITEALIDNVDLLIDASIAIVLGLANGIVNALPRLIEKAPVIIQKLLEAIVRNVPKLLTAAAQIIVTLAKGIIDNLPRMLESGKELVNKIGEGIASLWTKIKEWGAGVIDKIWNGIKGGIESAKNWGKDLIDNFGKGIRQKVDNVINAVKGFAGKIKSFLGFSEPEEGPLSDFHTYAPDMMELFMKGIKDNQGKLRGVVEDAFGFDVNDMYNADPTEMGRPSRGSRSTAERPIYLYLDGDKLVGGTSSRMDGALGDMQKYKLRWEGA